jgi:glycosyltransferase involved in cell wall biosynthesis
VATVIGHMRHGKGHDTALDAWPAVLAAHPDARLLLVGDGPGMPALRRRAAELGVAGRVVFAGARDDMPDVLRASDLVLLPSRIEALPTVLVEAAACGVPAVATRVGGVPEVVADGETGWLFAPPPGPDATARAVRAALDVRRTDPARFAAVGRAARARARTRFDAGVWANRLATAYRAAVAGHRLGHQPFRTDPGEAPP